MLRCTETPRTLDFSNPFLSVALVRLASLLYYVLLREEPSIGSLSLLLLLHIENKFFLSCCRITKESMRGRPAQKNPCFAVRLIHLSVCFITQGGVSGKQLSSWLSCPVKKMRAQGPEDLILFVRKEDVFCFCRQVERLELIANPSWNYCQRYYTC